MKYIKTKKGEIRTTPNKGHHKDLATKRETASAGRFTKDKKGRVRVYSKSYGLKKKPAKGDVKAIKKSGI